MKRFISGGYYKSDISEDLNNNNNSNDNNEEFGLDISNFYKESINKNLNKLPLHLSKRLKPTATATTITTETETTTTTTETETKIKNKEINEFYCDDCKSLIKNINKIEHETSITHILSVKTNENFKPVRYSSSKLTDSIGYKILRDNKGWNDGEGLGINNQGLINPIVNEKKLNKHGIGKEDNDKRVIEETLQNNILDSHNDPTLLVPHSFKKKKIKQINYLKKEREEKIRQLL